MIRLIAALALFPALMFVVAVLALWSGWIITIIWGWYLESLAGFSLPLVVPFAGIMIVQIVRGIRGKTNKDDRSDMQIATDVANHIWHSALLPPLVLGAAWIGGLFL